MATVASGRSMEKLATFETTSTLISLSRKAPKSFSRWALVVSPLMTGAPRCSPSSSNWSMYCPMTRICCPAKRRTRASVTFRLVSVVAQNRYFSSVSAVA
ncbi:hypothetical protein MBT84_23820 [Streptomyces sp. MBT84]|nr:hypothetical protein [Streptomyces sp. MBT84]